MLPRFLTLVAAVLAFVAASGAAAAAGPPVIAWAVAAGVVFVAVLRPAVGLMLVAAFAPLGGAIAALGGLKTSATEPLLLSVLAGWLVRRTLRRESWDVVAVSLAGSLALIVLASLAVQCALAFQIAAPFGLTFPRALLQWLTQTSDVLGPQRPEVTAALVLLEGCGLFAMAAEVCRREPSVAFATLRLLTLSVAAVAVLNINRFVEVVLRQDTDFWGAALHVHQFLRVSSTIPDVNAAGALFALILPAATWFCMATNSRRWMWSAVPLAVATGLWLSGSRAAMMGGVIGLVGFLVSFGLRHWTPRRTTATLTVVLVASAALIVWYPRSGANISSHDAWVIRRQLASVGFQMAREAPLFGIGVGRFFEESARLASAELRHYYSAQNAHNQVIQFLGELGVPGAALFLAVLGCSLAPGSRGPGSSFTVTLAGPVVFGILAWVIASLLMHPLLVAEVSAAFWLVLGLARSALVTAEPSARTRRVAVIPAVVAIVLVVTLPGRVAASRNAINLDGVGIGVSRWQRDAQADIRYRIARASSAIYVDGRPGRLRLPIRMARAGRVTTDVDLLFDGRPAGRLTLPSDVWTDLSMLLPNPAPGRPRYRRLEFRWTPARSAARLHIGRERYYPQAGQAATK